MVEIRNRVVRSLAEEQHFISVVSDVLGLCAHLALLL